MNFELKCCGKKNPLGVDKQNIRLSFTLDGSLEIASCQVTIWERATNKRVFCREQMPGGAAVCWVDPQYLQDKTQYQWNVTAYLTDGTAVTSDTAAFETGLGCWEGNWISGDAQEGRVLAFCKELTLETAPKNARLYICGLGYFSAQLNGKALDDSYFIPPVTDYSPREALIAEGSHIATGHRVTYYTYDVTAQLTAGSNCLYVEVAGGYYSNREKKDFEPQPDFSFGDPCLIYELHIEDSFGNIQKIVSNRETLVRSTNAVSQLYSGDVIDFAEAPEAYRPAKLCPAPQGAMTSPCCEPDKLQEKLTPLAFWETPEGTVYDFGTNHTGGLCFTAEATGETELTIRYAEVLREDGTLNFETAAWHGAHNETGKEKHIYQENTYRLKKGSNQIAPKFSWFCYRYVLIPKNEAVHISDLCSFFICMNVEQDGSFACAEDTLNRINDMFKQTLLCNMHSGLVMDCPHRERLPYTGDGKVVMQSAFYNYNVAEYYYKWFDDLLGAQTKEGLIPNSAPYLGGGGGYAWGNAICTVTEQLYALTGDMVVARKGYDAIRKWLSYYESKRDENFIIRSNSHTWMLGDWLSPDTVISNVYYISTVCYLQAVKTAIFLAELLDKDRLAQLQQLKQDITDGINRVFFDPARCCYAQGVQGENVLALAEDIVPADYRQKMLEDVRRHYSVTTGYHLDTGIVLTPVLIRFLTENGMEDIAFKIMTAKTYPSYFSLMEGDTTFSEHWSKQWPDYYFGEPGNSRLVKGGGDLSHCHPMFGSVAAWLYDSVAGLDLSRLYQNTVSIKPYFMKQLPWAKAEKKTAFGEISLSWCCEAEKCTMELSVPCGLTAKCRFPAAVTCLVNKKTGQTYVPDDKGFYDFTLESGHWQLTSCQTPKVCPIGG